jgi:hypothetical protein
VCTLYVDGDAFGNDTVVGTGIAFITPNASLSDGNYTWNVNCTTGGDSGIASSDYTFTLDTVNPIYNIQSPQDGSTVNDGFYVNISMNDTYLFQFNYSIFFANGSVAYNAFNTNMTDKNWLLSEYTETVGWLDQEMTYFLEVSDDHTAKVIKDYDVNEKTDALEFDTGTSIVTVTAEDKNLLNIEAVKNIDRYTFEFEYDKVKKKRGYFLTSTHTIYDRSDLYGFPAFVTSEHWVDFNTDSILEYTLTQINDTAYYVEIEYTKDKDKETFNSIGGLNIVNTSGSFYFDGDWSIINYTAIEKITNNQIYNFSINTTDKSDTTTNGTASIILNESKFYNVTITSEDYYNQTININHSQYGNEYEVILYDHVITFYATNVINFTALGNYTINLTANNYNFTEMFNTTGTSIVFNVTQGLNYTSFFNKTGWALRNASHINLSGLTSTYNYSVFTANSILITYLDADSLLIINDTTIKATFIGATKTSKTTTTGELYADNIQEGEYVILTNSSGYRANQYITTFTNASFQELTLYLSKENDTTLILLSVNDRFGNTLQGADITIQRYINNSWVTEQIYKSDFQGQAEGYFVLSTVYYNFYVDYDGTRYFGVPNSDENKKLMYAEDVNNGLAFNINLYGDVVTTRYLSLYSIDYVLEYVNTSNTTGYYRFYYDDPNNEQRTGCLTVQNLNTRAFLCDCTNNSVVSESSTLSCVINHTTSNTRYYAATAYIDGFNIDSLTTLIGQRNAPNWGLNGFLIGIILVTVSYLVFLRSSTPIAIMAGTTTFIILSIMGVMLANLSFTILISLLILGFMHASIKSESGVNK